MKFQIAINLERMNEQTSMTAVRDHTLRMVKMADAAGFDIVWAAEHHALEMTIAPNPFSLLTWWGRTHQKYPPWMRCGQRRLLASNSSRWRSRDDRFVN